MPLSHLEHFLVQTPDIGRTCDWYEQVLGLQRGPTPDFKFPVQWLYLGDTDVIHVTEGGANTTDNRKRYLGQQSDALSGTGVIDHVAFRCTGLKEMIDRLNRCDVPFRQRTVSDQGLFQLFLMDPNDVKIELNFAHAEAIELGIRAELSAQELPG